MANKQTQEAAQQIVTYLRRNAATCVPFQRIRKEFQNMHTTLVEDALKYLCGTCTKARFELVLIGENIDSPKNLTVYKAICNDLGSIYHNKALTYDEATKTFSCEKPVISKWYETFFISNHAAPPNAGIESLYFDYVTGDDTRCTYKSMNGEYTLIVTIP